MPTSTVTSGSLLPSVASVLLVDDKPSNLLVLSAVLSPLGVRVVETQSGREALARIREEPFAVVLLDVQMPDMDGFEVARRMRETENGRELPIIFLTAVHRNEAFARRGYAVGAADYVTKPFDPDVLRARVKAFVDLFQQRESVRLTQVAQRTRERDDAMRRVVAFERIATATLETMDLPGLLRELLHIFLGAADAVDSAAILLLKGDELELQAAVGPRNEKIEEAFSARLGEGFAGRIAEAQRPMEITEAVPQPHLLSPWLRARGTNALFGVPLMSDGQVLGVAHVGSVALPSFSERDKRLFLAVAERAAWAVAKHQERSRLHAILHTAPALIAIFRGPDQLAEFVNPTFEAFFAERDLLGEPLANARIDERFIAIMCRVYSTGAAHSERELEVQVQGDSEATSSPRFINVTAQPLRGPTGAIDSVLMFGVDVSAEVRVRRETEAHEAERARLLERERAARLEAEVANRAKDEFLATVSHELRTPLNAVLGWTARARAKSALPEMDRVLGIIERNAQAQARIVEDMLDLSRIISGKLRLEVRRVRIGEPIFGAIEAVRPAAEAKEVQLDIDVDEASLIHADPDRLRQIVWNLLSNAIKFTPGGGRVALRAHREGESLSIQVIDSGEGIEPEFLPYVFEPFRQADGSTTRRHGGLGLGLAIVKQLVQAHGGSLQAESAGLGQGSTFTVHLPIRHTPSAHSRPKAPSTHTSEPSAVDTASTRLDRLKVLVVDDEEDARSLLVEALGEQGAVVTSAASMAAALDEVERAVPDLIVSDIGMPHGDGYTLIRRIRQLPDGQGGNVPAIALTAYARSEDVGHALAAGFQAHLAKPVDVPRLLSLVAALSGSRRITRGGDSCRSPR